MLDHRSAVQQLPSTKKASPLPTQNHDASGASGSRGVYTCSTPCSRGQPVQATYTCTPGSVRLVLHACVGACVCVCKCVCMYMCVCVCVCVCVCASSAGQYCGTCTKLIFHHSGPPQADPRFVQRLAPNQVILTAELCTKINSVQINSNLRAGRHSAHPSAQRRDHRPPTFSLRPCGEVSGERREQPRTRSHAATHRSITDDDALLASKTKTNCTSATVVCAVATPLPKQECERDMR